jgi:hypothetical protein
MKWVLILAVHMTYGIYAGEDINWVYGTYANEKDCLARLAEINEPTWNLKCEER